MLHVVPLALALTLGASKLHNVPLKWMPEDSQATVTNQAAHAFQGKKVKVAPFTDARIDKELIGRNVEEDEKPRDVTTHDDVGAWCAAQLAQLLRKAGVQVVEEGADVTLSGEVITFFVEEGDRYRGTVALKLSVAGADGAERWAGQLSGDSDRFGRSYKYDNYMETLSDGLLHAAGAFFATPAVGEAAR